MIVSEDGCIGVCLLGWCGVCWSVLGDGAGAMMFSFGRDIIFFSLLISFSFVLVWF